MPNEEKKQNELKFSIIQMCKSKEACSMEYMLMKTNVSKYLSKFKQDIGEDLYELTLMVLDSWEELIYNNLIADNRDLANNLSLYTNLSTDKTLKIKIEHIFAWNFFKNIKKFIDNLLEFATMQKINNFIKINDFSSLDLFKKINFFKKMSSLSFSLILELRLNMHCKKLFINIYMKIDKYFNFKTSQTNQLFITNNNIFELFSNLSSQKTVFPMILGANLSKKTENILGFQIFGNKKNIEELIGNCFSDIKKNNILISFIKAKEYILEIKFDDKQYLEWELLYRKSYKNSSTDDFLKEIMKNKEAGYLMKNIEFYCKGYEYGLNYASNYTYFVKKFTKIKHYKQNTENIFDKL